MRLVTQNINGISPTINSIKEQSVKDFAQDFSVDIFAQQQLNVCWNKVKEGERIWDRFKGWRKSHNLSVGFNAEDKNSKRHQSGGVALLSLR